ncbi:hypothetical protein DFH07DRAFT_957687 [Mycena maculata]|uniref:Uncharacterized protein n=1 Tax=Mycena maculata TaxID=230809 RepID=A0AAD7JBM6_9AGAR|nr:hypothetical protein DFH07DRAFT_957687 [Mycena maculata]
MAPPTGPRAASQTVESPGPLAMPSGIHKQLSSAEETLMATNFPKPDRQAKLFLDTAETMIHKGRGASVRSSSGTILNPAQYHSLQRACHPTSRDHEGEKPKETRKAGTMWEIDCQVQMRSCAHSALDQCRFEAAKVVEDIFVVLDEVDEYAAKEGQDNADINGKKNETQLQGREEHEMVYKGIERIARLQQHGMRDRRQTASGNVKNWRDRKWIDKLACIVVW